MTAFLRTPRLEPSDLMSERALQDAIVEAARRLGYLVYFTWSSRHSPEGFPDLICVKNGKILIFELKTARGRLRPMQEEWLNALRGAHVQTSRLVRPRDLDDVLAELQEAS